LNWHTIVTGRVALVPILELTLIGAAIAGCRVAVVALLEPSDDTVAALGGRAGHARTRAGPAGLSRAARAATVIAGRVAIVAGFRRVDPRIATDDRNTENADRRASVPRLDHQTIGGASVVVLLVAIIAGLYSLALAVTAVGCKDHAAGAAAARAAARTPGTAVASDTTVTAHAAGATGANHASSSRGATHATRANHATNARGATGTTHATSSSAHAASTAGASA